MSRTYRRKGKSGRLREYYYVDWSYHQHWIDPQTGEFRWYEQDKPIEAMRAWFRSDNFKCGYLGRNYKDECNSITRMAERKACHVIMRQRDYEEAQFNDARAVATCGTLKWMYS